MDFLENGIRTGKMTLLDLITGPFFYLIIIIILIVIGFKIVDERKRGVFFIATFLKIIGSITFPLIYQFYYGYGDTFRFYKQSLILTKIGLNQPSKFLFVISHNFEKLHQRFPDIANQLEAGRDSGSFLVIKFGALLSPICFFSYINVTLLFSLFSFIALWKLFQIVTNHYPQINIYLVAAPLFFVPTVFFWSSGFLKDGLSLAFFCFSSIALIRILQKKNLVINTILLIVNFYLLYVTKSYIAYSFGFGAMFFIIFSQLKYFASRSIGCLLTPVYLGIILLVFSATFYLLQGAITELVTTMLTESEETANYLYELSVSRNASAYSLGDVEYTPVGLIKAAPKAISVTLFRPFLWEASNPVFMLSAIESSVFIIIILFILLRKGLNLFKIYKDPFAIFCFSFSMFLALMIGISTFNFGTLVRYKLPVMPFFGLFLLLLYFESPNKLTKKKEI